SKLMRLFSKRIDSVASWVVNASDALDKIRFESLADQSKLDAHLELFIRLVPDKVNKTLSIFDSGIAMTKACL
ncbi:hypothetical protein MIMGU_mgv1a021950mg, partial [Erythranthe guttata]